MRIERLHTERWIIDESEEVIVKCREGTVNNSCESCECSRIECTECLKEVNILLLKERDEKTMKTLKELMNKIINHCQGCENWSGTDCILVAPETGCPKLKKEEI
jgi:hypothetical protein